MLSQINEDTKCGIMEVTEMGNDQRNFANAIKYKNYQPDADQKSGQSMSQTSNMKPVSGQLTPQQFLAGKPMAGQITPRQSMAGSITPSQTINVNLSSWNIGTRQQATDNSAQVKPDSRSMGGNGITKREILSEEVQVSVERLKEAVIWAEILDKPLCKRGKRRK